MLNLRISHTNLKNTNTREDWFLNQGYALNFEIKSSHEANADCNRQIFNNGRFSCMLPDENCAIAQRNNAVYEYISKIKSNTNTR